MVRKAINAGLQWRVEQDIERFFHLYAENARAHGTPALPKKFFSKLSVALGSSSDILFVFDAQGQAISAIMSFYDKGVVHAGFAGELPAARGLAANDFKYGCQSRVQFPGVTSAYCAGCGVAGGMSL